MIKSKSGLWLPRHIAEIPRKALARMKPMFVRDRGHSIHYKCVWTIAKWNEALDHRLGKVPNEVLVSPGNLLLNAGITELLESLTGTGTFALYNNANAHVKVGNSATAASATQTDLQGGSTDENPMDTGFPTVSAQTATWKSTFGSTEANFAWEEGGVKNGAGAVSATVILLNRKVTSLGTKTGGNTWTAQVDLTLS